MGCSESLWLWSSADLMRATTKLPPHAEAPCFASVWSDTGSRGSGCDQSKLKKQTKSK